MSLLSSGRSRAIILFVALACGLSACRARAGEDLVPPKSTWKVWDVKDAPPAPTSGAKNVG